MKAHPIPDTPPSSIRIEAGCTLPLLVRVDTYLQVRRGRVVVHDTPRWLADTMVPAQHRLVDGQGHHATHRGWVHLHALAATELVLHQPAGAEGPWRRLAAAVGDRVGGGWADAAQRLRFLWRQRVGWRT